MWIGLRSDLVTKGALCSSGGPGFEAQHTHNPSQLSVATIPLFVLLMHQVHMWFRDMNLGKTPTPQHKNNKQ